MPGLTNGQWSSGFLTGPNSISSEVNRTELKTDLERKCFLCQGKFCVKSGKTVACQRKASCKAVKFWKEVMHLREPEKIRAGF